MEDKCFTNLSTVVKLVLEEHERQLSKWGLQNRSDLEWLSFLVEEVGELAREITDEHFGCGNVDRIIAEAVQVSTLSLKIVEMYLEKKEGKLKDGQQVPRTQ